ncbi:MAG TPA: hypothetical protein PKW98_06570, partial [Candidatus Wallbacteria bacterium]|nr:hypothetical protein [Candidatus Wallbacteria bacterium]
MIKKYESKIINAGIVLPMALVIIAILSIIGFSVHKYMQFERNIVARLQYTSAAEKMAQAAALEATGWYNAKAVNYKNLDKNNPLDRFVMLPTIDSSVNSAIINLSESELQCFQFIRELGGALDTISLKYEGFQNYFNEPPAVNDFAASCYIPSDPFERFGALVITAKVSYKTVSRTFYCRYEIKVANTLAPVLSKFTLFVRDRDAASENQLIMRPLTTTGEDYGGQGIVSHLANPLRVPLIFIHHPDDVKEITAGTGNAYYRTHAMIREFLPLDETVTPAPASGSGISYRPSITDRGWVYLGCQQPDQYYNLNIAPGKANPEFLTPYPQNINYRFFGNGFLHLESDLCALAFGALRGNYPFNSSFSDAVKPGTINDYILRITHMGIYWLLKHPVARPIIGNFYDLNPGVSENASLLQLSGDMQAKSFSEPSKPLNYLDRRSPTLILGKVARTFAFVGQITQNTVHPNTSPKFTNMLPNGMHKLPYEACGGAHPNIGFLPYFNIDDNGTAGSNPAVALSSAWGTVDDTKDGAGNPFPGAQDFSKTAYSIKNDVFKCVTADHLKNYKFFMCKILMEPYNKCYDWIAANSTPAGGAVEPGAKYGLKQNKIKIISSYPDAQADELFFYVQGGAFGNCIYANKLKISQYKKNGAGSFDESGVIFPDGIFKGALGAVTLSTPDYQNPLTVQSQIDMNKYDIRHKTSFIFNTFDEFKSKLITQNAGSISLKESGIFYIDDGADCDLTFGATADRLDFDENTMLIFKKGVKIPCIFKSAHARSNANTFTLISVDGDITIAGSEIEASLNSLNGTIKKAVDYFQVFGNMTMAKIHFDLNRPGSLFK